MAQDQVLWDSLGFGVPHFDNLWDGKMLLDRVLDLGEQNESNPSVLSKVTLHWVDDVHGEKLVTQGFDEFSRKLMTDVNTGVSFGGFQSSVSSHFSYETSSRKDYYFSRTAYVAERAHIRVVGTTKSELRDKVYDHVAKYLATKTPQEIFSKYGTHVTTGLVIGGMLELWSSSNTSQFSSKKEFSNAVSASYKGKVNGETSLSDNEKRLARKVESKQGLSMRGGQLHVGENGEAEWIKSTVDNAQPIGYLQSGAVPIWDLIPDQKKSNQVKESYETIYGPIAIILKRFSSPSFDEIPRSYRKPEAQIYVPNGWKVVSGGASVKYSGSGHLLAKSFPITPKGNPNGAPIGWKVNSGDHTCGKDEHKDSGKIQAHAVAIWDPSDAYDVVVRKATSKDARHPSISVQLPSGYTVVGGGAASLYKGNGNFLVENYPDTDQRTWHARSKEHYCEDICKLEVYVIGIKARSGASFKTRIKSNSFGPAAHPKGNVYATYGYGFIGGGAKMPGITSPGHMLVELVPSEGGASFYAKSKDHQGPDYQKLTIFGIEVHGPLFVDDFDRVLGIEPRRP